jgi:hypothetical protein
MAYLSQKRPLEQTRLSPLGERQCAPADKYYGACTRYHGSPSDRKPRTTDMHCWRLATAASSVVQPARFSVTLYDGY